MKTCLYCIFLLLCGPYQLESVKDRDLNEGIAQAHQGNYDKALEFFQSHLEMDKDEPLLNYYVGLCLFFSGRQSDSKEHLLRSVENEAPFPEAYYWTAQVLDSGEETSKAKQVIVLGLERFPKNQKLNRLYLQLTEPGGKPEEEMISI